MPPNSSGGEQIQKHDWLAPSLALVLNTRCAVGVCDSPLLQVLDKFSRDAGLAELSCRLPYLAATDIPVGTGLTVRALGDSDGQVLRDRILQVLIHPGGKKGCGESLTYLGRQGFEHWRPDGTDHDAGIDIVIRTPTLFEIVRAQVGIGGLQRLCYGHEKSRRFRLVCLRLQVEESTNHV